MNDIRRTKSIYPFGRAPEIKSVSISKDGMAICQRCGSVGVKHAFYTKERKFCSMVCARGLNEMSVLSDSLEMRSIDNQKESKHMESNSDTDSYLNGKTDEEFELEDDGSEALVRTSLELSNSFSWNTFLQDTSFEAAPVSCFKHCPMADVWDNVIVGMKVEVNNSDTQGISYEFSDSFWVATVLKIAGYKVLLRYEGFGQDSSLDFWVNLCLDSVHPVGWCATQGKPLIPPKTILGKYLDWKEFLVKRLTGARTLPTDFNAQVKESLKPTFRKGQLIEVVDKTCISQMKIAVVTNIVGRRLQLAYLNENGREIDDFFCFEKSPLIHPVGWSHRVGHSFVGPPNIRESILNNKEIKDAVPEYLFLKPSTVPSAKFEVGMKLEAVDPLNLSSICAATIMKVLKEGYIMIKIDSYEPDLTGADWFCYHVCSPYIFPIGFCEKNSIRLVPPKGQDSKFSWKVYLEETNSVSAPLTCFQKYVPDHNFHVGQRLEAVDLMDPKLICVATITHVVGRLLKIHFDGWEEDFDQWIDKESPDIFPVGWCENVGHKLEGPKVSSTSSVKKKPPRFKKKRKGRVRGKQAKPPSQRNSNGRRHSKRITDRPDYTLDDLSDFIDDDSSNDGDSVVPMQCDTSSNVSYDEDVADRSAERPVCPVTPTLQPPANPNKQTSTPQSDASSKIIPRIIDGPKSKLPAEVIPETWSVLDVAQFLKVNDCANYCDNFDKEKIDGKKLMSLSKDQLLEITCMKVGPSLKIHDLIQQLRARVNPAAWRQNKHLQKS